MTMSQLIQVARFYTRQGRGFKVVHGLISFDNLEKRSAAHKYVHMEGNKVFVADTGAELIEKIQHDLFVQQMDEMLNYKLDIQSKIKDSVQTDWKE